MPSCASTAAFRAKTAAPAPRARIAAAHSGASAASRRRSFAIWASGARQRAMRPNTRSAPIRASTIRLCFLAESSHSFSCRQRTSFNIVRCQYRRPSLTWKCERWWSESSDLGVLLFVARPLLFRCYSLLFRTLAGGGVSPITPGPVNVTANKPLVFQPRRQHTRTRAPTWLTPRSVRVCAHAWAVGHFLGSKRGWEVRVRSVCFVCCRGFGRV